MRWAASRCYECQLAMLMTMYSAGLRRAGLCRLKVSDIDSQRMMLRVENAPGKQRMIGREFNRRLKQRFDKEGVEIPFLHRELITETPAKPPTAKDD